LEPNDIDPDTEVVIAPPNLYLLLAREHLSSSIEVAAQNCFDRPNGAFTGEISVEQLKDSGITWTLLGHSERRTILREEDEFIAKKTLTAVKGGIGVILCCGESLEEREKGTTVEVVTRQLEAVNKAIEKDHWKQIVIAYEPIWAIGTGKVATTGMYAILRLPCLRLHSKTQALRWLSMYQANDVSVQNKHKKSTQLLGNGLAKPCHQKLPKRLASFMEVASTRRIVVTWPSRVISMASL
jgi:hypothetical protein